jgi:hypothetical protein
VRVETLESSMATMKYFSGDIELKDIFGLANKDFDTRFPGARGFRYDGYAKLVGHPVDETPVYDRSAARWVRTTLPVDRRVSYKSNPSRHECDARCVNATGRTMQCECSCGGKNHGKGAGFGCYATD